MSDQVEEELKVQLKEANDELFAQNEKLLQASRSERGPLRVTVADLEKKRDGVARLLEEGRGYGQKGSKTKKTQAYINMLVHALDGKQHEIGKVIRYYGIEAFTELEMGPSSWYTAHGDGEDGPLLHEGPEYDTEEVGKVPQGLMVRVDLVKEIENKELRGHICEVTPSEQRPYTSITFTSRLISGK